MGISLPTKCASKDAIASSLDFNKKFISQSPTESSKMQISKVINTRKRTVSNPVDCNEDISSATSKKLSDTSNLSIQSKPPTQLSVNDSVSTDITNLMNASQPKIVPVLYRSQDNGSYIVYVYSTNRNSFIHPTLISSIAKVHIPGIAEIKKIGKGKILIECPPTLPTELRQTFAQHNLHAFIPAYKVLTGIIQDIPVEIDIETIRSNIEAPR